MYFQSISDALQMAGHGAYVWSAYALTAVVVIALLLSPIRRSRTLNKQLQQEVRRQAAPAQEDRHAPQA